MKKIVHRTKNFLTGKLRFFITLAITLIIYTHSMVATEYFLNSVSGNDGYDGKSAGAAWQTLAPLQALTLQPGDIVNFACGSSWTKSTWDQQKPMLLIDDNGTAAQPIIFRSYGSGVKPTFSHTFDKYSYPIRITADYVTIDGFRITKGFTGFDGTLGADNNTFKNCEITGCGHGFVVYGQNNKFTSNYIHDLVMVVDNTIPDNEPGGGDYGCVSFWLYGPNNEISYNRCINNIGHSYDYQYDGGFIECYTNTDNTYAHHNWVEIGMGIIEGSDGHGANMKLAYNVFIENKGFFALHFDNFSVSNFKFENNTCITRNGTLWNDMLGGVSSNMTLRNNIFVLGGDASEKVGKSNSFNHSNNLYYLVDGATMGSVVVGSGEKTGIPFFVDESAKNFQLQSGSPAKNAGANLGYTIDFIGNAVPSGGVPDMGAYELQIAPQNLVTNPTFDTNTTGWGLAFQGTGAATIASVTKTGYTGKACKATITNGGSSSWGVQMRQTVPVTSGKTYTLTFKASADANRTIGLAFYKGISPYTPWWSQASISLTTTPTTKGPYTFNCTTTDATNLLSFLLGSSTSAVYIDDVVITESNTLKSANVFTETADAEIEQEVNDVTVYPNPVADVLKISLPAAINEKITISIIDMQGRIVNSKIYVTESNGLNPLEFDVQSIPQGTYLVQINAPLFTKSKLFIKK